jgi:hypothetical protein
METPTVDLGDCRISLILTVDLGEVAVNILL